MFERGRHNILSIISLREDFYELPKKAVRANGNFYHIFKLNDYGDVQNLYQDKPSMDVTLDEFKYLTVICWNENHQPPIIDMTNDKYTDIYIV